METLTETLREAGYQNRILTEKQLARLLGGADARRYGLVNRALKAGELVRIRRGLYVLADRFRDYKLHPFRVAQALCPGSYVSLETALAHHGWIPEAVYATASIIPGRKSKAVNHPALGRFTFHPLALHRTAFLELVDRIQIDNQTMLVARPARALMDIVCFRKIEWRDLSWLEQGMRIDLADLLTISKADLGTLRSVYKHKAVLDFLAQLELALAPYRQKRRRKTAQ